MGNNRIQIFTGAYGSGKTEVSMNYAVDLMKEYSKVGLIDLDIVNPYFRSREAADLLTEKGVEVIFPSGALATADLPALSPDILRLLQDEGYQAVIDVGGDNVGAIALGRFKPYFTEGNYEMNFVVNTLRPFTSNVEGIQNMIEEITQASRLNVSHLVANINLCGETTGEDIVAGYKIVQGVSEKLQIPVKYIAVEESLQEDPKLAELDVPIKFIHLYNRPGWLK